MEGKLRIYVDEREKSSQVPMLLSKMGVLIIYRQLKVGDYILPGSYCVERKTAADFINSLYDGRLFDQVSRMSEAYDNPILVVEGDFAKTWENFKHKNAIFGALASLSLDFNVKIFYTHTREDTARLILALARRSGKSRKGLRFVIHKKPPLEKVEDWQLYVVQSLPNVGPKLALRLLEKFGSPIRVFNASIADLSKVEGLGVKRAERIFELLRRPFRKSVVERTGSIESFFEKP